MLHRESDWARAFFLDGPAAELANAGVVGLLPALAVPRLVLYEPHFRTADDASVAPELLRVEDLVIDVADGYFAALLEARLTASPPPWLGERSAVVMSAVPAESRHLAYRTALVDFGSYLLALASAIERTYARRGAVLCALPVERVPLLSQWGRAFGDAYPGRYLDAAGGWRITAQVLPASDRRRFLDEVLESSWTGDAERDFATLCDS